MTAFDNQLLKLEKDLNNCYKVIYDNGSIIPVILNVDNLSKTIDNTINSSSQELGLDILGQILNKSITSIENSTVTELSSGTFADCVNLTSVNLPNVTTMYDNVFSGCTSLTSVNLPNCEYIHKTPDTNQGYYYGYYGIDKPREENGFTFQNCNVLETLSLPKLKTVEQNIFVSSFIKTLLLENCEQINTFGFSKYNDSGYDIEYVSYIESKIENLSIPKCKVIQDGAFLGCPNIKQLDLVSIQTIGKYAFRGCTGLQKIWIPSTCTTISETSGTETTYPFNECSCIIYTDAESPQSGWGAHWNYSTASKELPVIYGATHKNYEDNTTPVYPYTITVTGPQNSTVIITYHGIETTGTKTSSTTIRGNDGGSYRVKLSGYSDYTGTFQITDSDLSITVDISQMHSIPDTIDITYSTIDSNMDLLQNLIDNNNFIKNSNFSAITSGPSSYNVNNGTSYGYIECYPTQQRTLSITGYVSSESNYDYGSVYVGTSIYKPTQSQLRNGTTDGNGQYVLRSSGSNSSSTYTMILEANKMYYINFAYCKDSSANRNSDRLIITKIQLS